MISATRMFRAGLPMFLVAILGVAFLRVDSLGSEALTVQGRQVLINGQRFMMQGVCYAPTPVGRRGSEPPHNDFFTTEWRSLYQRDLPLMRSLGVNCVRVYSWSPDADHSEFLDLAWNGGVQPIRVMVSHWIDPYTDWRSARAVEKLKRDWTTIATNAREHPAVLGYVVGNELNQAPWNPSLPSMWRRLNEIAGAIRLVDTNHLVTTALADTDLLEHLRKGELEAPNFNAWCIQAYRGDSFKTLFADYHDVSRKPLFLSEFGLDAHDARLRKEFPANARIQAEWIGKLWTEIKANPLIASGGAVFAWTDQWGKLGRATRQDPGGWHNGAFPDGQADEEWYGIHRVRPGKPDVLEPRAAVATLQRLWVQPIANAGEELSPVAGSADAP